MSPKERLQKRGGILAEQETATFQRLKSHNARNVIRLSSRSGCAKTAVITTADRQ